MNEQNEDKWVDELISKAVDTSEPKFDAQQWAEKFPEAIQALDKLKTDDKYTETEVISIFSRRIVLRVAAAAVILIAAGLFLHMFNQGPVGPDDEPVAAQSPAKMTAAIALTIAYNNGGIEALDEQLDKVVDVLGPVPASLSLQEFLTNGSS